MDTNKTVRAHHAAGEQKYIYIFDASDAPRMIDLKSFHKERVTFGRVSDNDIVLQSQLVSRYHGEFRFDGKNWWMIDLGSTNGLTYNNKAADKVVLKEDEFVRIDDGVETVRIGALFVFPSSGYSPAWRSKASAALQPKVTIPGVGSNNGAVLEWVGGSCYLAPSGEEVYLNKQRVYVRTLLHEKDIISCANVRIVYTAQTVYSNVVTPSSEKHTAPCEPKPVYSAPAAVVITENDVPNSYIPQREAGYGAAKENVRENVYERRQEKVYSEEPSNRAYEQANSFDSSARSSSGGFRRFIGSSAGYYLLSLLIAVIVWGVTVALWTSQGEASIIVVFICAFFGWRALNSVQPAMFLWMSWMGWLIYFFIKFILSAMIGLFVTPFKIGKWLAGVISGSVME